MFAFESRLSKHLHLHTKTCFSLFDSFDFFRSGWFSFLFAIFKTPSTCDVLNFALSFPVTITSVTMCCGAHRSTTRGISFLPCPYFYSALRASCGKLRFPKKSRCPSGNVLGDRGRPRRYGDRGRYGVLSEIEKYSVWKEKKAVQIGFTKVALGKFIDQMTWLYILYGKMYEG